MASRKWTKTETGICGPATRNKMNEWPEDSWDEIKYFKKDDFKCPCCGYNIIDLNLVMVLDDIREHFSKPIIITSGTRCSKHNRRSADGIQGSKHVTGQAADFYVKNTPTKTTLQYCQYLVNHGRLLYTYTNTTKMKGAVHINL